MSQHQDDEFTEQDTVPDCSLESLSIVFNYDQLIKDRSKMHKITRKSNSKFNNNNNRDDHDDRDDNNSSNGENHSDETYYVGASNNFVRVFTLNGRKYWIAQALCYHRAPDMKIHFSVKRKDVPKAFNVIGKYFFESGMKFGMKSIMIDEETEVKSKNSGKLDLNWNTEGGREGNDRSFTLEWPDSMRGREITVYIYRYFHMDQMKSVCEYDCNDHEWMKEYSIFDKGGKYDCDQFTELDSKPFQQFELVPEMEEPLRMFRKWIRHVEYLLEKENIEPNGCADGDLPLGGKYASFRNETFIPIMNAHVEEPILHNSTQQKEAVTSNNDSKSVNDMFFYPPNFTGWNAANNPQAITMYNNLHLTRNASWDHFLDHLPLISIVLAPIIIGLLFANQTP
ncbi:predicted protein [Naegleria gruberi]|uniref:Predicted protein n=1 Tax=Naegleria gruberi TaxID=5762 RepID=D2VV24_NAEGR|nr:uncharacterized protein NAEGRDRAFT_72866 [Naegleria gruberi]EFC39366.1 predicted protein [Naegleria gruberi]|eukprot:XP_002672110.1 predicted protein [Naegleria gruberi strain NEG-M]